MPARRASKASPIVTTNTTVVTDDGTVASSTRDEPPRKRSKVYDDDRIGADIRAVYPNWEPVDPFLLMEHGFAGSPSSSTPSPPSSSAHAGHPQDPNNNITPLDDVSRLRLNSISGSGSGNGGSPVQIAPFSTPSSQIHTSQARTTGKGRGRGRGGNKSNRNINNATRNVGLLSLRNAEHDIPEIVDGPYATFLDRHGQRPEYFPACMLKRLEKERQKRSVAPPAPPAALPATPESMPSPTSSPSPSSSETLSVNANANSNNNNRSNSASTSISNPAAAAAAATSTSTNMMSQQQQHTHTRNGNAYVWIVTHTEQGGYDRFRPVQRGIPDSSGAGSGVRFHGVFSTLEDANVKAMEVFQKLHRDFMLHGTSNGSGSSSSGSSKSGLGFGVLGPDNSLGFLEMPDNRYHNNNATVVLTEVSIGSSAPFFESHPALQEDAEGASWWVDDWGCLSLRAMNWGTGDSRIFVARQEFNR